MEPNFDDVLPPRGSVFPSTQALLADVKPLDIPRARYIWTVRPALHTNVRDVLLHIFGAIASF